MRPQDPPAVGPMCHCDLIAKVEERFSGWMAPEEVASQMELVRADERERVYGETFLPEVHVARIRRDAATAGPNTEALVDVILRAKPHPEQGFRSCIGILRLARTHGAERLEAACERALEIGAHSYSCVAYILSNNLDRRKPGQTSKGAAGGPAIDHSSIRGPQYFH